MNLFLITQEDGKYTLIVKEKPADKLEYHYNLSKREVYVLMSILMDVLVEGG